MEPSCFNCTHQPVCKYADRATATLFPFRDDSKIGPFMTTMAKTLAEACAWYVLRPDELHKPRS